MFGSWPFCVDVKIYQRRQLERIQCNLDADRVKTTLAGSHSGWWASKYNHSNIWQSAVFIHHRSL